MKQFKAFSITLANIEKNLHKARCEHMAKYGLRSSHLTCMIQINAREDGLSPTEISKVCSIDKAFVSRITSELFSLNLIKVNEKFDDGRKYKQKYVLTEQGLSLVGEIKDLIGDIVDRASEDISDYEMRIFYKVLFSIDEGISKITE